MGKRELVALLSLSSWCLVIVVRLFLAVSWVYQQIVVVVYPDHTRLNYLCTITFFKYTQTSFCICFFISEIQRKNITVIVEKQTWPLVDKRNEVNHFQKDNKKVFKVYTVLWYNTEVWMRKYYIEAEPLKQCKVNNCNFTTDKSLITKSAAVVFCISCPGMPKAPPISRAKLPLNQVWLFHSKESPINIPKHDKNYRNKEWIDAMNWSMTYRMDSDITFFYGVLQHRTIPRTRNYTAIFQRKTKTAAWIVSHCRTESKREVFIENLRKHGLEIDVYGACGKRLTEDPEQLINRDYKFYLGFENSLCKDYVSEKFFKYYSYDAIVVVRGGADYSYLLPNDTFIDTTKFKTVKELVSFLMKVGSSEELFTNYMRQKEKYISILRPANPFCELCEKLNNIYNHRNTHHSIVSSMFNNACHEPRDIH